MSATISIPKLVEASHECIMVPCVYDCASARAVELAGYQAMLLSGGEVGEVLGGIMEDCLTEDELFFMAEHICKFSPLPLIIDCGCFGESSRCVNRFSEKFAKAGSMGLLIEDGGADGFLSREEFFANIKAAVAGCKGTDCVVIGRCNWKIHSPEDLEEIAARLNGALEQGAYMVMPCGLNNTEDTRKLGKMIHGLKCYPDQNTHHGIPEVANEEIYPWGFAMISFHYTLKVAMESMIRYGKLDLEAKNNKPSNDLAFDNGVTGHSALPMFDMQKIFDKEAEFTGIRKIFRVPGMREDD